MCEGFSFLRQCGGMCRQVRSLKQKVVLLLDKSVTDDSLIAALRSPAARLGTFASSAAVPDQGLRTAGGKNLWLCAVLCLLILGNYHPVQMDI